MRDNKHYIDPQQCPVTRETLERFAEITGGRFSNIGESRASIKYDNGTRIHLFPTDEDAAVKNVRVEFPVGTGVASVTYPAPELEIEQCTDDSHLLTVLKPSADDDDRLWIGEWGAHYTDSEAIDDELIVAENVE